MLLKLQPFFFSCIALVQNIISQKIHRKKNNKELKEEEKWKLFREVFPTILLLFFSCISLHFFLKIYFSFYFYCLAKIFIIKINLLKFTNNFTVLCCCCRCCSCESSIHKTEKKHNSKQKKLHVLLVIVVCVFVLLLLLLFVWLRWIEVRGAKIHINSPNLSVTSVFFYGF